MRMEIGQFKVRGLSCKPNIYVSCSTSEIKSEVGNCKTFPSSFKFICQRITVFSHAVKYFTDRSKAVLLLWIFYGFFLSCVCYAFVSVCLYVPCGHCWERADLLALAYGVQL